MHSVLIARRVAETVAELARREFDALLPNVDLDVEQALHPMAKHGMGQCSAG